ncbi:DUF1543 domain-containing protein [Legionella micdadei]|uniref:DUF1543 domain-containing protein n=1 Tax=Legionella micdadei TaxID=451 RepID=A0A098GF47_LEGMI|nr:DUF1543 domain-containing protein [Legionella micdadei]ARG97422.1 hypothetical protein B6N58_06960 [Legionella micdadei]ARH00268.1 hypothetical protein B6V88_07450 [Legionella micdadei]KTD28316.1 hypothetical protein Lmic_1427 [Legionella micdadei]NSL16944.1 DUF1543 domain-containing protein [Legionella micdadei]CEG61094.1 conserved protein of unknown function [Legionella micdadei]
MLKLFAVLLGGRAEGCNTELHDVVFVVGASLEETYPKLVNKWFGVHKRLHIDAVIELKYIDGHEILIDKKSPSSSKINKTLFFVNFGGYKPNYFGELHEVKFYVESTKTAALARAKQDLGLSLLESHCDDNIPIDDIMEVEVSDNYFVYLQPSETPSEIKITPGYFRLDTPEIIEKARNKGMTV